MKAQALIWISLVLVAVIALVHSWGLSSFGYWRFPYLDLGVHFLGGAWLASTVIYFWGRYLTTPKILFVTLVIGILWEIFELLIGGTAIEAPNYVGDTTTDLIADISGAALVAWIYLKSKHL